MSKEPLLNTRLTPLRIILLGFGSVARAFIPLLTARREWLQHELAIQPLISGIGTRSAGYYIHPSGLDPESLTAEPLSFLQKTASQCEDAVAFINTGKQAGASVLLELTTLQPQDGEPARSHIRTALELGMHVITANKGPIAYAQSELQKLAQQNKVQLRFESTVMDGLPLFNLAQYSLPAVGITAFRALLNTTSSLVLSMIEQGNTLEEAIKVAQKIGVAEANPWYDLDGWDALMKTTILANNLLDAQIMPSQAKREGIRDLSIETIRAAAQEGSPFRLVSQATQQNGEIFAEVKPQRIKNGDILHVARGTTSVISLETEAMGTITLVEHEPVVLQTAYGVLSDLITILRKIQQTNA